MLRHVHPHPAGAAGTPDRRGGRGAALGVRPADRPARPHRRVVRTDRAGPGTRGQRPESVRGRGGAPGREPGPPPVVGDATAADRSRRGSPRLARLRPRRPADSGDRPGGRGAGTGGRRRGGGHRRGRAAARRSRSGTPSPSPTKAPPGGRPGGVPGRVGSSDRACPAERPDLAVHPDGRPSEHWQPRWLADTPGTGRLGPGTRAQPARHRWSSRGPWCWIRRRSRTVRRGRRPGARART